MFEMKLNKNFVIYLIVLVAIASLYRIIPNRPLGFAPQIAMALFGGALFVKDKKWAFILPLLSMFISDCLYQFLYMNKWSDIPGFYSGQLVNYVLFAGITFIGFAINKNNVLNIALASLAAPTAYFLVSNFLVWASHGGYQRPFTFNGLMQCFADGLPFYKGSLLGTIVFSAVLFGSYFLIRNGFSKKQLA
jgi:hypothetical protein